MAIHDVPEGRTGEAVARRMLWLAYEASVPVGMGFLHYTTKATEDDVFKAAYNSHRQEVSADYVFGRMIKLVIRFTDNMVDIPESRPRIDYQSWCRQYPTHDDLLLATLESLDNE